MVAAVRIELILVFCLTEQILKESATFIGYCKQDIFIQIVYNHKIILSSISLISNTDTCICVLYSLNKKETYIKDAYNGVSVLFVSK